MCHVHTLVRRTCTPWPGPLVALLLCWAAVNGCKSSDAPATAPSLVAARVEGAGPMVSLDPAEWEAIAPATIPLTPQAAAVPMNLEPATSSVRVRMRHNDDHVSVLLEWDDPTRSDALVVDQFGDQIAIQYPIDHANPPSAAMGASGQPVVIMQWRSPHGRDLTVGAPPSVPELFPNAHVDLYTADQLPEDRARPYTGAVGLGNPVSRSPENGVLIQIAEGFGSLTALPSTPAHGRGEWANGVWRVVISHPLDFGEGFLQLRAGLQSRIAFAVWEGGNNEVGSRKAWASWVPLRIGDA